MATHDAVSSHSARRRSPLPLYAAEAFNSIAGTLLTVGLPFYMNHRFGWGARENFAVAACQGALYICGALSAKRVSRQWGREASLPVLCTGMVVVALGVGSCASMGWALAAALLAAVETGMMGASWPMLESLLSGAGDPSRLSQRLGYYNIVWATTGAVALGASGAVIQYAPAWAFFGIVAAAHLWAGVLVCFGVFPKPLRTQERASAASSSPPASDCAETVRPAQDQAVALRHRLALRLSRIALPSTYVVIYSIAPVLPTLHAIKQLSPATATLAAGIWLAARAAAFFITGNTVFWHKRPGLLLVASISMLAGFLGTILSGTLVSMSLPQSLLAMAAAQIVLGMSIGTIYSASLYFGMALSDGSTEHGGYHEALIGLGQVLGPVVGLSMQWMHPGGLWPSVLGISTLVSATVAIQAVAVIRILGGVAARAKVQRSSAPEAVRR